LKNWSPVSLIEVAQVLNGKTPSKDEQRGEGHPVLKIRDVSEIGEYRGRFESFVDPALAEKFDDKQVRAGDTLILNAAHNADYVGSKMFRAQPATYGALATGEWLIVRPNQEALHAGFAYHWVTNARTRRTIRNLVNGIHLYPKDVAHLKIPLPPLSEQRRIAEVLDRAEALRTKRRNSLARLDILTDSIFLDLFGDPATNPKRFPTPKLGNQIVVRGGFAFKSGDYVPEGIPLVRIGEVNRGRIDKDACFLPHSHELLLSRFIVRPGDLLMSLTGTTGKDDYANVILLDNTFDRYFLNQRVALIEPAQDILDRRYLLHCFRNPKVKEKLTSKSRGIRQANISNSDVQELELPIPPITLQREFVRRMTVVEKLNGAQRSSQVELDTLFASLQQRAFRGEL
jgi:type I restriction enzyme S subunit